MSDERSVSSQSTDNRILSRSSGVVLATGGYPRLMGEIENKLDQVVGDTKEKIGGATDNEDLQAEGALQNAKGNLKDAGEKIKDAFS